jgi:prepilin-type N-terminal cleavage/methylation domain-containing protein
LAASRRHNGQGFTLIELLVVIAIIALLVGMLAPSLTNARLLAKRAVCQDSLKSVGSAVAMYQTDFDEYVPICWANLGNETFANKWRSWWTNLLPYGGYRMFNCPSGRESPKCQDATQMDKAIGEIFHSADEVTGQAAFQATNAGSYGLMYQDSLASYATVNYANIVSRGNPCWSLAFSTKPGVAWRDPANSAYVADACFTNGPLTYPSQSYTDHGTAAIYVPTDPDKGYFGTGPTRRFADRHLGTNCLFLGGYVLSFKTAVLDNMVPGQLDCVWDTE